MKLFVRLRQIRNPFDESDDPKDRCRDAAGQDRTEEHDQARSLVAEHEFVDSQTADYDSDNPARDLLAGCILKVLGPHAVEGLSRHGLGLGLSELSCELMVALGADGGGDVDRLAARRTHFVWSFLLHIQLT